MIDTRYDAVAADLGSAEIDRRIANLSSYQRYQTIVALYDDGTRERGLTPAQMTAWAAFAKTLGAGVTVDGQNIKREKTRDELVESVLSTEYYARQRADREAKEAAEKEAADIDGDGDI